MFIVLLLVTDHCTAEFLDGFDRFLLRFVCASAAPSNRNESQSYRC
jgi:hypothetical protein